MALDHSRPHWRVPKRIDDDAMLGGVASGLATELSVDAVLIRVGFVVLALAGGFGVIVYAAAFVVMQTRGVPDVVTPKATSPANAQLAVVMLLIGLMLLARSIGFPFSDSVMWPAVLLAGGVVFANDRGVDLGPRAGRWPWLTRFGGGAALVTMGVVLAVSLNFSLVAARDTLIVVGVVVAGLALVAAPTVARLARELTEEWRERIRSDERADVAAHLHDSVLQTLSLIQRESADPNVVGLARQQERELRGWLFSPRATAEGSMRAQLEQMAADVERVHLVAVEVVVVGEAVLGERGEALLGAARESVVNAATHAGVTQIDVIAEVTPDAIFVFVRDTGVGFDPHTVPADRHGVADSIIGRMRRAGGQAEIVSSPGAGTEVELQLPLEGS